MKDFLASLLSKKLGFAAAVEAFLSTLPMSADAKGMAMAGLAVAYVLGQAYLDTQVHSAQVSMGQDPDTLH